MEKHTKIHIKQTRQFYFLVLIGTICIAIFYGRHIRMINTVWELGDEYGYMANAAYMVNSNWSYLITAYFGYGYSVLLLPFFMLYNTGIELIQSAILVNTVCIVLMFWIETALLSRLCSNLNKKNIAIVSCVLCFFPYLITSSMKVICECFLSLMMWVVWLLLYKALTSSKKIYYILLGGSLAYLFFIHVRSVIIIGIIILFMVGLRFYKRIGMKQIACCTISFLILFIIGYCIKYYIISGVYTIAKTENTGIIEHANIINLKFITDRIRWLILSDFKFYIYTIACKTFYLYVASIGFLPLGIYGTYCAVLQKWKVKKRLSDEEIVKLVIVVSFVGMMIAVFFSGAGDVDQYQFFYYGRYYEYIMMPLMAFGIDYCFDSKMKIKVIFESLLFFLILGIGSLALEKYLTNTDAIIDTGRMAAFTCAASNAIDYKNMLQYIICLIVFAMICCVSCCRKKHLWGLMLVPVVYMFMYNDYYIEKTIKQINESAVGDNHIVDYLDENYDEKEIYFVNTEYKHQGFYTRMQVLLGYRKLVILEVEHINEIPDGAYFVTYHNNPYSEKFKKRYNQVIEGSAFELYIK